MNTTEFLAAVKRAMTVPSYQARYSDNDMLGVANEEMANTITPMLTAMREDYMVKFVDIPTVPQQQEYQIPRRALGMVLREVWYLQNGGASYQNMPRIHLEDSFYYQPTSANPFISGNPFAFYIRNDKVAICPLPQQVGTLRLWYFLKPSKLVLPTRTLTINSLTYNTVTALSNVPSNISADAGSNLTDITSYRPGYTVVVQDAVVNQLPTTTSVELAGFTPSDTLADNEVVQFDVLSTAGETSIIQLPDEIATVLIFATAKRILQGLGFPQQIEMMNERLEKAIRACNELIQPRVEGELQKIVPKNGMLRGRWRYPSLTV